MNEINHLEREISRMHGEIAGLERDFPPSLLRRFDAQDLDQVVRFARRAHLLANLAGRVRANMPRAMATLSKLNATPFQIAAS